MAEEPAFLCDAMLGGLARWLRAAGYSAWFDPHVADGALVRKALEAGKWLLTSDSGIQDRHAVSEGLVRCLFVPRGLSTVEQLGHVLGSLDLPLRPSRCMDCDGELEAVEPAEVAACVPPKVRRVCTEFFRCRVCGKVYWHGTHWVSIRKRLARARELAGRLQGGAGR